jgi:hypothetical protein
MTSTEQNENSTYQGWTNYPTWAVNLWLSNDEGLYNATAERVAEAVEEADEDSEPNEDRRVYSTSEALKQWVVNELAPDLGASFAADLMGYALDQVDWREIAEAWLSDIDQ